MTGELDLKALAAAVGGKRAAMAEKAAAERATGYVVGGISPLGQRQHLAVVVDTTALDRRQLVDYYIARHKLNDELQLYSHDSAQGHESWRLTVIYAQLIVENTEPESVTHLNFRLRQAIGARDYPQAVEISERLCSTLQPLSREYAEASYMRALVADLMDDTPTAQVWFARSAMTDIQLAIRDNAALKSLANTLLDDDDVLDLLAYILSGGDAKQGYFQ